MLRRSQRNRLFGGTWKHMHKLSTLRKMRVLAATTTRPLGGPKTAYPQLDVEWEYAIGGSERVEDPVPSDSAISVLGRT